MIAGEDGREERRRREELLRGSACDCV